MARSESGEPLPTIFPMLAKAGIKPRYSQVTMIAGVPKAGKSNFALFMAIKWVKDHDLWGLYFTADTDMGETKRRSAACVSGHDKDVVEQAIRTGNEAYYDDLLEPLSDLRFVENPNPSPDDIELEMAAFEEAYGAHPDFVVIDNLLNVTAEMDDEHIGLRKLTQFTHWLAREYGSAVFVLHHMSEASGKPGEPMPRKAVQSKVSQFPEVILSIAGQDSDFLLAAVANRNGPQDAEASNPFRLYADMGKLLFAEHRPLYG